MKTTKQAILSLSNEWQDSGVTKGDTLLIHSRITRTLTRYREQGVDLTPFHILESFLAALGNKGTLILPLFNFNFSETKFFDIRNTPSQMGALTELGRNYSGSIRTGHPIYSFGVIGMHASRFDGLNNISGYGADSPFAILKELDGKIGVLDLEDQNSMTFYHHVEEMHNVSYRYFKEFEGNYIDHSGSEELRTYKLFVRDLEKNVITNVNPAGELMWEHKLYHGNRPLEKSGLRTIKSTDMFNFVSTIIKKNGARGVLYDGDD